MLNYSPISNCLITKNGNTTKANWLTNIALNVVMQNMQVQFKCFLSIPIINIRKI